MFAGKPCIGDMWHPPEDSRDYVGGHLTCDVCGAIEDDDRRESEPMRTDCGNCYGNGCSSCGGKGWVETEAGRIAREEWEDGAYDRAQDARIMGED